MPGIEQEPIPHLSPRISAAVADLQDAEWYDQLVHQIGEESPEDLRELLTLASTLERQANIPKNVFMLGAIARHRQVFRHHQDQELPPDPFSGDAA